MDSRKSVHSSPPQNKDQINTNPLGGYGTIVGDEPASSSSNQSNPLGGSVGTLVGLTKGMRVGDYEIVDMLGEGGMGTVYRGRHHNEVFAEQGGDVAIKVMKTVDEESLEKFRGEIFLMHDLRHANICTMIGACWDVNLMALVMEFCEKGSLKDVMKKEGEQLTWDDPLLKWCMDIGRAMAYLHNVHYVDAKSHKKVEGIVHRDLKPDNCLVSSTYSIKVADFGEARAVDYGQTMTQVSRILFSLAIEQLSLTNSLDRTGRNAPFHCPRDCQGGQVRFLC